MDRNTDIVEVMIPATPVPAVDTQLAAKWNITYFRRIIKSSKTKQPCDKIAL